MLEKTIRQQKLLLFAADMAMALGAFWLAYAIRFHLDTGVWQIGETPIVEYRRLLIPVLIIWGLTYTRSGLYKPDPKATPIGTLWRFVRGNFAGVIVLFALTYLLRMWTEPSRWFVFFLFAFAVLFGTAMRMLLGELLGRWFREGISVRRILVVGAGDTGRRLADAIRGQAAGFRIAGFLDDTVATGTEVLPGLRVLGTTDELENRLRTREIDEVLIALAGADPEVQKACMEACLKTHAVWKIVPSQYEMFLDRISVDEVGGVPLIGMKTSNIIGVNYLLKRGVDLAVGSALLLFCMPMMAVIALAVKLSSPGPVFYRHTRIGYKMKPFEFLKFRSMRVGADREKTELMDRNERQGPVFKMQHDPRTTPVGRFIRKFSLDELPQILHVLTGQMSLIGPRPPLPDEVAQYEEWQKRRLDAPPGITGLWQVSGRHRLSFDEMIKLDLYYIENWSMAMDLKIAVRTIIVVVTGDSA